MKNCYEIKNCPCYDKENEECLNTPRDVYKECREISRCFLKRIVEKCKSNKEGMTIEKFQKEILKLFEVEQ